MNNSKKSLVNRLKNNLKNIEFEGPEKNPKIIKRDIFKVLIKLLTWLGMG